MGELGETVSVGSSGCIGLPTWFGPGSRKFKTEVKPDRAAGLMLEKLILG